MTMNVSFAIYGILLGSLAVMTWHKARQRLFDEHEEWALRLFGQGSGSFFYRILVAPLFLHLIPQDSGMTRQQFLDWLNIAGWLFWPIPLAISEAYIVWIVRPRCARRQEQDSDVNVLLPGAG
mmetsp:Transcript_49013/g.76457  ORF Transcript_49013/g.76457 Transcript_49013/m.76457 type:complete len:123 (-) Transcript_49013:98-466(-)